MAEDIDPDVVIPDVPEVEPPAVELSIAEQIQAGIDAALKPIKENLNSAYAARDAANAKAAALEQEKRDAELARLKAEGKEKEAFDMELATEKAKREAAELRNVELTRDIELKTALAAYDFKTTKSMRMAYSDIVSELVRNEQGVWTHKSGASIEAFVKTYSEDATNHFLFKQKTNSGGGGGSPGTVSNVSTDKKSLFTMTQAEVLKIAEGKI